MIRRDAGLTAILDLVADMGRSMLRPYARFLLDAVRRKGGGKRPHSKGFQMEGESAARRDACSKLLTMMGMEAKRSSLVKPWW